MGLRAVATAYGLDFVPMEAVRCDLVIPQDFMTHPAVKIFLDTLQTISLRRELAGLPGYDSACTGRVIGEVWGDGQPSSVLRFHRSLAFRGQRGRRDGSYSILYSLSLRHRVVRGMLRIWAVSALL